MPTSLFIEQHNNGLAFYINGDLQFDTADEAIYHEYLVIPSVALAVKRFPHTELQVLICGGGDGLAARDVLRFPEVSHVDLVDYNPEVLELGKNVFKEFNDGSLESEHLTIYTQEAFDFLSAIKEKSYHVIICDFTYPSCTEDTAIYSQEWFKTISRVLYPGGIISTNGVSPENRTTGFWCLYQTLLAAGLMAKPLQLAIPSFQRHDYGNWGFFLASPVTIQRAELEGITLPENLQAIALKNLLKVFEFENAIAHSRHSVNIHTLDCPQLFYYLLNPHIQSPQIIEAIDEKTINFLDIEEAGTGVIGLRDLLQLESTAQRWLEEVQDNEIDTSKLLPVQHPYHNPKMTAEWLAHLQKLLSEIDLSRLLGSILERAQELPPQIAAELKQLSDKIRTGQQILTLSPRAAEFIMMLSVTLLMANLASPDAVFAKGYYSGSSHSPGSSGYSGGNTYYSEGDWSWFNRTIGFVLTAAGGIWLINLLTNRSNND
ncbi:spermine synthase [Coleofasciculus sp. FACHB-129]|uniref:spermine/spermidine synthase domain-containing protein n=1 Tax=Cyanophyceae TaxID=3028117 RepID=UPI00168568F4|nr:spermine synthase [Coleofasciculus sp. FACHB-129]MBD1897093.1 spermine synthase [Coleofasciculus sp. FACHB-129]